MTSKMVFAIVAIAISFGPLLTLDLPLVSLEEIQEHKFYLNCKKEISVWALEVPLSE